MIDSSEALRSPVIAARRGPRNAPWVERSTRAGAVGKSIILVLVTLAVVFPFVSLLSTSFASDRDVLRGGGLVLIPLHPTLNAYRSIFRQGVVTHAMLVSVGITVVGTLLSLSMTTAMAYGLSRRVRGSRVILLIALLTLLFVPGIIPSYLIVKQLGMLNSYASLIIPVAVSAFNLVVLRQFFMEIPKELLDSARIDGAGDLRILLRIVLPLSKPAIAVVSLFYAVGYWNAFFYALLYLNETSSWPLQLIVRFYALQGTSVTGGTVTDTAPLVSQSFETAVVVVATVPILVVYPFLQRYFTKGVLTGAIKG